MDFDEEGVIKLQCRPPKDQYATSSARGHSQSRPSCCLTLFNIVSPEEAEHIGMTDCHILYGTDFDHTIKQQRIAERVEPEPIPPRVPTPPNRRAASPTESTISIGSRLDPRSARHEPQGGSSGYSMTYKNQYGEELSLTAPRSETNFMSSVRDIIPRLPAAASFLSPSPMLIQGAAANHSSRTGTSRGPGSQNSASHTIPPVPPSDYTGFGQSHKRKATDDVAPTPFRRPHWMDEPTGSGDL